MHTRPFTPADFPTVATITADAFFNDKLCDHICPGRKRYPEHFRTRFFHELKIKYYSGRDMFVVVMDDQDRDWNGTEVVMGYATFYLDGEGVKSKATTGFGDRARRLGFAFEKSLLTLESKYITLIGSDLSVDHHAISTLRQCSSQAVPISFTKPHWHLAYLCTAPAFQRRGVGTLLLDLLKDIAVRDSLPILFTASPMGQPMYKKNGFRHLGDKRMPEGWEISDWFMGWGDIGDEIEKKAIVPSKGDGVVFEGVLEK